MAMMYSKPLKVSECCKFLRISYNTFKLNAKNYIDVESGLNLFDYILKQKKSDRKIVLNKTGRKLVRQSLSDIFEGKVESKANVFSFVRKIRSQTTLLDKCERCGFSESRLLDGRSPMQVVFKDGNVFNRKRENLNFYCYNCTFLESSFENFKKRRKYWR